MNEELNQWIAMNLFGYRWYEFESDRIDTAMPNWCSLLKPAKFIARHNGREVTAPRPGIEVDADVPQYSTDPAAAMQVLEKCLKSGHEITLLWTSHFGGDSFSVFKSNAAAGTFEDSLPLAICLFAQKLFTPLGKTPTPAL